MSSTSNTTSRHPTPSSTSSSERSSSTHAGSSRGGREREGGSGASRDLPNSHIVLPSSSLSSPRNLCRRPVSNDSAVEDELDSNDDEEGDDEDPESSEDSSEEESTISRVVSTKSSRNVNWTSEMKAAYERAIRLFPDLSNRCLRVGKFTAGRNGMIGEYIRRPTGVSLNRNDVGRYARLLRLSNSSVARNAAIRGAAIDAKDLERLITQDWSSVLGPDLFPHVRHCIISNGSTALTDTRRALGLKVQKSASKHKKKLQRSRLPSPSPHEATSSSSSRTTLASATPPSGMMPPPPPSRPSTQSTPLTLSDLAALLTSFAPSHDFSSSAVALFFAGLTSLDDLDNLLAAEQTTYESVVELMVEEANIEEEEGRWVSFAMGEVRSELLG